MTPVTTAQHAIPSRQDHTLNLGGERELGTSPVRLSASSNASQPQVPMLETPRPSTPMSISFAHNDDSRASVASVHAPQSGKPTAGWKRDAGGDENVQPGGGEDSDRDHEVGTAATADPVEQKKVQELEDAIRKRRSIIPSLTSELAQLEEQIKAAEERTERLARAAALAKV